MKTLKRIMNYLKFINEETINAQVFIGRGKF
jgi:hypothetical protein